jgi:hypothetical protein
MRVWLLILTLSSAAGAAETCPWLNAATAGGFLGGRVTNVIVSRAQTHDDARCEFIGHGGSLVIDVETMPSPATDFPSYLARCHSPAEPLRAIGNKAVACGDGGAEQVVGRVRDRAFLVRISTTDHSSQAAALRDKARKIAEQVAGILF